MRKIDKTKPIGPFQRFVRTNPTANWRDFHELAKDVYFETREHILLEEQNCLCGYTELPIEEVNDCHLDHYVKRDFAPNRTFDWNNLIASCNDDDFGAKYKDNTSKIRVADYTSIFNPVEDDVQQYFYYNEFGEIEALPDLEPILKDKVAKTVAVFNLEHPSLVERRKRIIEDIKNCSDGMLDLETIKAAFSPLGFKSLVRQYCSEENNTL
jgi:uncharacterized protein (TIGR02646 family)